MRFQPVEERAANPTRRAPQPLDPRHDNLGFGVLARIRAQLVQVVGRNAVLRGVHDEHRIVIVEQRIGHSAQRHEQAVRQADELEVARLARHRDGCSRVVFHRLHERVALAPHVARGLHGNVRHFGRRKHDGRSRTRVLRGLNCRQHVRIASTGVLPKRQHERNRAPAHFLFLFSRSLRPLRHHFSRLMILSRHTRSIHSSEQQTSSSMTNLTVSRLYLLTSIQAVRKAVRD